MAAYRPTSDPLVVTLRAKPKVIVSRSGKLRFILQGVLVWQACQKRL